MLRKACKKYGNCDFDVRTHSHTHVYIYIYIQVLVCVPTRKAAHKFETVEKSFAWFRGCQGETAKAVARKMEHYLFGNTQRGRDGEWQRGKGIEKGVGKHSQLRHILCELSK